MNEWKEYYFYWATLRGNAQLVKPRKYLGMKGWRSYLDVRLHEGKKYVGEVWECITQDGNIINAVFRVPYTEVSKSKYNETSYSENQNELQDYANYHFDGIEAYTTGIIAKRDRRQLINRIIQLKEKISHLRDLFMNINDSQSDLKLGIQLYLRRLQNPTHITSREWKEFTKKYPHIQAQIIDSCNGKESMGI